MARRAAQVDCAIQRPDPNGTEPLYSQVADAIENRIRAGQIHVGERLPAERRLATRLGISRTTVTYAYEELEARGLLKGHVGRGTIVVAAPRQADTAFIPWTQRFGNVIADAAQTYYSISPPSDTLIPFATGWPDPELCPSKILNGINRSLSARVGPASHGPSLLEGDPGLRDTLAEYLASRGLRSHPDDILVTAGAQEGLSVVARAFITPGDIVVTENPTWMGAIFAFRSAGAEILSVPVDQEGIRCDLLADVLGRYRPKLIYVIPNFHNPTGAVLSLERRRLLLEMAARFRVPIVESDVYGEIFFESSPPPALKALDEAGLVIYSGSLSKIVAPGLRIGWLVAPREAMVALATAKCIGSLVTATLPQTIAGEFIRGGHFERHLATMRHECRRRRDKLIAVLRERYPELRFHTPAGGYYLWLQLPPDLSSNDVVWAAQERGVTVRPGWHFSPLGRDTNYVRVCFAATGLRKVAEGARRLIEAVQHLTGRQDSTAKRQAKRPVSVV